jgi:cellulose synthase/poly-beta-1,6-N-acetylglucosamine synthase-like glycosyltransferase
VQGSGQTRTGLAGVAGATYLTRPDNSHAKAGNISAALPRIEGELALGLDADHVPMPDALDAMGPSLRGAKPTAATRR